jgi:hypothetical protein
MVEPRRAGTEPRSHWYGDGCSPPHVPPPDTPDQPARGNPVKIETLAGLVDAYRAGTLDRSDSPLIIDSDEVTVYDGNGRVYRSDPETLLGEALAMLGIPHDNA